MRTLATTSLCLFALIAAAPACGHAAPAAFPSAAVETGLPELVLTGPPSMDFIGAAPGSLTLADRMAHYGVPGVSIAVVEDFAVVWTAGYGVLDSVTAAPVTPAALFEAASTTKMVTAAALWSLVAEGRLAFDDPVGAHLETWRLPPSTFTAAEPVTIRRLLSHTAGLNRPDGGFAVAAGGAPTLVQVLSGEAPALNAPVAIEAVPGSRHSYSNIGYLVLQQLLQDVEGKSFAELVGQRVFTPLGMAASTFAPAAQAPRARHHGPAGEPLASSQHPTALAQGGLWTTPADLGRLAIGIMASVSERARRAGHGTGGARSAASRVAAGAGRAVRLLGAGPRRLPAHHGQGPRLLPSRPERSRRHLHPDRLSGHGPGRRGDDQRRPGHPAVARDPEQHRARPGVASDRGRRGGRRAQP